MATETRLDISQAKWSTHEEADREDLAFWLSKTPQERLEGIEAMRRWAYGEDAATGRLQRVFEVVRLGED